MLATDAIFPAVGTVRSRGLVAGAGHTDARLIDAIGKVELAADGVVGPVRPIGPTRRQMSRLADLTGGVGVFLPVGVGDAVELARGRRAGAAPAWHQRAARLAEIARAAGALVAGWAALGVGLLGPSPGAQRGKPGDRAQQGFEGAAARGGKVRVKSSNRDSSIDAPFLRRRQRLPRSTRWSRERPPPGHRAATLPRTRGRENGLPKASV